MKKTMQERISFGQELGLSRAAASTLARLRTPHMIQDYITALKINFELKGDTCLSAAETIRQRQGHCIEGAFVAACALWIQGYPPLLMDLKSEGDDDHVVTLFRESACWGAISKSNHIWLRWRDPVYRTPRELAMSYFHEYSRKSRKTLRSYSAPFDLRRRDIKEWVSNRESCWDIAEALDASRHYALVTPAQVKKLRPRDKMELRANGMTEYTLKRK